MRLHRGRIQRHGLQADADDPDGVKCLLIPQGGIFQEPALAFEAQIERELKCQSSVNDEKDTPSSNMTRSLWMPT